MSYILLFENPEQDKFIFDYLRFLNINRFTKKNVLAGPPQESISDLKIVNETVFSNQIQQSMNSGLRPVIFLNSENGCNNVKIELESLKSKRNLVFDYFIFPNNETDGTIIHLLENIICGEHAQLLNCIEQYFSCVGYLNNPNYIVPAINAKMVSYIEILKGISGSSNTHIRNVNFNQSELWDLNSNYLNPLRNFINSLV